MNEIIKMFGVVMTVLAYKAKDPKTGNRQQTLVIDNSNQYNLGMGRIVYNWIPAGKRVASVGTQYECSEVEIVLGKEYENSHNGDKTRSWQLVNAVVEKEIKPKK